MRDWSITTIGDHCTVTSSKRFHLSERSDEGVPFYCSKEIIQKVNGVEIEDCDYIREELYEQVKREFGVPEAGDLLITTRGTYGVPYIYQENDRFYFADGNLTWLKDFDNDLIAEYLYYWVRSYEGQKKIDAIAKGTAQKAVPIAGIKTLQLALPPVSEQKKIVKILLRYDNLIENNQKQIKLLEEAAQRLYKVGFVDLHFPGYENRKIVDGLPEGWQKSPIGKMVKIVRGRSYSSKELSDIDSVLMINLSNIRAYGGYNRNQEKRYNGKYNDEQVVETHDLLMGVTDMTQERRTVGRVALVPNLHAKAMISMDLIKLIPNESSALFLYALLNYGGYSEVVSRFANGTNVLHLRPDVLDIVDVVVPDAKTQGIFVDFFGKIQNLIDMLQDEIIVAGEARDRLLPKLMSGEIEV